jgi:hypothetical protein
MNKFLAAILLIIGASTATSQPRPRQVELMCGSFEDVEKTMAQYNEKLVMATQAPNEQTVNLVYANFETETTSWFVHDLRTDEYCMMGVGKRIYIPDDSVLKKGIGIGLKTAYN